LYAVRPIAGKPLLSFLRVYIHEDLARVEGIPVDRVNWAFLGLIALTVANRLAIPSTCG
jgi:zinc transport system permease protein